MCCIYTFVLLDFLPCASLTLKNINSKCLLINQKFDIFPQTEHQENASCSGIHLSTVEGKVKGIAQRSSHLPGPQAQIFLMPAHGPLPQCSTMCRSRFPLESPRHHAEAMLPGSQHLGFPCKAPVPMYYNDLFTCLLYLSSLFYQNSGVAGRP